MSDNYQLTERRAESPVMRRAVAADLPAISGILKMAVTRMLSEGKKQWDESYPTESHARADLDAGRAWVLESEGKVAAYGAIVFDGEPAYDDLRGKWLTEDNYVVVHRIAVDLRRGRQGFGVAFMRAVEELARSNGVRSFRIDTNFDNHAMLGLLEKLGFTYCGDVTYERGWRMAFEKPIV